MKDTKYSLKDIKQLFNPITKKNKRIELEKRNAMASLKIAAAKTIKKTENYAEIDAFKAEIKAQLKDKKISVDAFVESYDERIKALSERRDGFVAKKDKQGGVLRPADENSLKMYAESVEDIKKEKADYLAEEKAKTDVLEVEAQKELAKKEAKIKAEQDAKDAVERTNEEAKAGREVMKEKVKKDLEEEAAQRRFEEKKRELEVKK